MLGINDGNTSTVGYEFDSTTADLAFFGVNCTINDTECFGNNFTNLTLAVGESRPEPYTGWQAALTGLVLSCIIGGTVVGNILVVLAVALVRKLRTPSNLLIVSLALADMSVGVFVMPFAAMMEIMKGYWTLGEVVCDFWVSLDVLLCTASILNLCMISIDRYFVITRPLQYAIKRTPKLMAMMITIVWGMSALISIPPLFGWKQEYRPNECNVSQEIGYQVYATLGAFYIPLSVMIVVYYRIFRISARLAQAENKSNPRGFSDHTPSAPPPVNDTRSSSGGGSSGLRLNIFKRSSEASDTKEENHNCPNGSAKRASRDSNDESRIEMLPRSRRKIGFKGLGRSNKSSDSKAIKTLGVIMGCFIACWLPFFILAIIRPFAGTLRLEIPPWVTSLLLWLGYLNSLMNPIIYAKFNREFRTPFKEILLFRCKSINSRLRTESYAEQYGIPVHLRDSLRRDSLGVGRRESANRDNYRTAESVVRCNNQGETSVHLGNGTPQTATEETV